MIEQVFDRFVDHHLDACRVLLQRKGGEYSQTTDRLSNFKGIAKDLGLPALTVAMVYMTKHFDSLRTYVRERDQPGQRVLTEPIEGRLHDLINYCLLMLALMEEDAEKHPEASRAHVFTDREAGEIEFHARLNEIRNGDMATKVPLPSFELPDDQRIAQEFDARLMQMRRAQEIANQRIVGAAGVLKGTSVA